jgi:hypothetical protein
MTSFLNVVGFRVLRFLSSFTVVRSSERRVGVVFYFGFASLSSESSGFAKVTLFDEFGVVGEL